MRQKEQFINDLNDETIIVKIIKELTALKDISKVSSEQVLMWTLRVGVQRGQRTVLDNIRNVKEFDSIRKDRQKPGKMTANGVYKQSGLKS